MAIVAGDWVDDSGLLRVGWGCRGDSGFLAALGMTIFSDDEGVTSGMAIVTLRLERIDTPVPCLAKHARHGAPALRIFSSANRTDAGSGEVCGNVFMMPALERGLKMSKPSKDKSLKCSE